MRFLTICFYSGIALLVLCIVVLLSPLRDRFSNATQKIQGFGLNLEVSVLTLLVLISVALMSTGIWMSLQDVTTRLSNLEKEKTQAEADRDSARLQLENARKMALTVYVNLEGVADTSKLDFKSLSCKYTDASNEEKDASVSAASGQRAIKVTFTDLQRDTVIFSLRITNGLTGESWVSHETFRPLQPALQLFKS